MWNSSTVSSEYQPKKRESYLEQKVNKHKLVVLFSQCL